MRASLFLVLFLSSLPLFAVPVRSQNAPSSILEQSLAAQTSGVATQDLTLAGTISFPHSAQTGSFPVTLTVLGNGTSRMVTSLPAGIVTHVCSILNGMATVSVTGPNGETRTEPAGNNTLMPAIAWFFPSRTHEFGLRDRDRLHSDGCRFP